MSTGWGALDVEELRDRLRQRDPKIAGLFLGLQAPAGVDPDAEPPSVDGLRLLLSRSPLELRAQLAMGDLDPSSTVLVAHFDNRELSNDLRARLERRRFEPVDPWRALCERFGVRRVDPRLADKKAWLVDLLHDVPREQAREAVASARVLTLEEAQAAVWRAQIGFQRGQSAGGRLLQWLLDEGGAQRWKELEHPLQDDFLAWAQPSAGPELRPMLLALREIRADQLVAFGLLVRVLIPIDDDAAAELRTKLRHTFESRYLGEEDLRADAADAWAAAAEARAVAADEATRVDWVRVAGAIFEDELAPVAAPSDFLEAARVARAAAVESALRRALDAKRDDEAQARLDEAMDAIETLRRHVVGSEPADHWTRLARLVGWLRTPDRSGAPFVEMMAGAVDDVSWVDHTRDALPAAGSLGGSTGASLAKHIVEAVAARRAAFNERFGTAATAWFAQLAPPKPDGFVLLEDVLEEVVAPLAGEGPTLLLVADGLSSAVYRAFVDDLEASWTGIRPQGSDRELAAIAALPTVTSVCRTSLLTGELVHGTQAHEKKAFAQHAALLAAGGQGKPVLFHKAELGADALAAEVRETIENTRRRVVGVVLNAVDDSLGDSTQIARTWGLRQIPLLGDVLRAAREAGRTVVLVSDHGHVVDRGTERVARSPTGARCRRPDDGEVQPGEVLVDGPRVVDGPWVLPWSEDIRFANAKRGYHGGISPQEVIVPLSVWTADSERLPKGWQVLTRTSPSWWRLRVAEDAVAPAQRTTKKPTRAEPQRELPGLREPADRADVAARLAASPTFAEQLERARGSRVRADDVIELVRILDRAAAPTTSAALAARLGMPTMRFPGFLASAKRILNVEGYEILAEANSEVRLDSRLLQNQFPPPEPNEP